MLFFPSMGSYEQFYSLLLKISHCLTRTVQDLVQLSFKYSSHMEARIRSNFIQRAVLQTPESTCFSCRGMDAVDAVWLSLLLPFICLVWENRGRQKKGTTRKVSCTALGSLWFAVEHRPESNI